MTPSILRLVRHKTTQAYWGNDGEWTCDHASARHFEDIQSVLRFQRQWNLSEIELVLQTGPEPSPEYDIVLPLKDPPPDADARPPVALRVGNVGPASYDAR